MSASRDGLTRWVIIPFFLAILSATAAAAKLSFIHLQPADATDHLFGTVIDKGADARPIDGTVTETASQARVLAKTGQPLEDGTVTSPPLAVPVPAESLSAVQMFDLLPAREVRRLPRAASVAAPRPVAPTTASLELRRLRAENQALKKLVTDLTEQPETASNRNVAAPRPPAPARLAAVVSLVAAR